MSESGGPPEDGSPADDASGQERLLAEALRAQAGSASGTGREGEQGEGSPHDETGDGTGPAVPSGFGLLSGAEAGSLERERAALDAGHPSRTHTAEATPGARHAAGPPGRWLLLLAVLLGLAAGAVAGLLTLV